MINRREFVRASAAATAAAALAGHTSPLFARQFVTDRIVDPRDNRMRWWRDARFGMFVHFGLYSVLGGEWKGDKRWAEWIRNNAQIPRDDYDTVRERFNPTAFDADRLASFAAAAGMKYLVFTTKHHDGFALWPTKQDDFNVTRTPYGRDIMRQVADACRRHGVVPCWYHSIMDWHHPDYLPRRDWEGASRPVTGADFDRYVRFLHAQVEELLTQYGDIGVMWFDGEWESTWNHELGQALADKCHALQPNVLINSRVGPSKTNGLEAKLGPVPLGDFGTPEQKVPEQGLAGVDWESCMTMNDNWGFKTADTNFKTVPQLVALLVDTASKGGNLLLNVGPDGTGAVPQGSVDGLNGLARWMQRHGDAIHGTSASPFSGTPYRATTQGRDINCFLADWPKTVLLPGLTRAPRRAYLLGDARRVPLTAHVVSGGVEVILPASPSDPVCSVLRVERA